MSRILLVEDHEEIWDFLSRRLTRRGHEVTVATDGRQGIDRALAEQPDVVLLDMNLPFGGRLDGCARNQGRPARKEYADYRADGPRNVRRQGESPCSRMRRLSSEAIDFSRLVGQIDALAVTRVQ